MTHTQIKLCGLKSETDINAANKLNPDYIGFVFAHGRKRTVEIELAEELSKKLNENIKIIGVFKNNDFNEVLEIAGKGFLSMIQLHGKEDDDFIKKLKEKVNLPIMKAFGIAWKEDIDNANKSIADYVLLDTPGGGTGFLFDHELLDGMKRDFFLAGGLNPENVADIMKEHHPFAVDVSTGIETDDRKDPKKMEAFVNIVRDVDRGNYEK